MSHNGTARRRAAALTAALICFATSIVVAPAAHAATWCGTRGKTWYLSDGSISLRLMTIKTYIEVCTDNTQILSATETTKYSFTGPALTTGWVGDYGPPVRTAFNSSKSANFRADGYLKDCIAHFATIFCGHAEDFFVNCSVTMQPLVVVTPTSSDEGLVGRRVFRWSCTPHDQPGAHIHFNTTI